MKVYNRVVVDIFTGETIEEDSFNYEGPVAKCNSGGGGSSGTVDFPQYMKDAHGEWLDNDGVDVISANNSVTALIDSAITSSPFSGETVHDPDDDIALMVAAIQEFETELETYDPLTIFNSRAIAAKATIDDTVLDETSLAAATTAHGAVLDDRLTTEVLPRFKTGLRDVNAVISTSFTIGQAILEAFNTRDVAEFDKSLRLQSYSQRNQMIIDGIHTDITFLTSLLSYRDSVAKAWVETYRIKSVLKKEEFTEQMDIDAKDAKWGLDLYQFGANVLASISGSAVSTMKPPSTAQSVIGGAFSGAAVGASVSGGSGKGTAIGAIGGAILGAL